MKHLTQAELLQLEMSDTNPDKNLTQEQLQQRSKPLIHKENIPGTPFWVIGDPETGYSLFMGNHRLSYAQETIEECKAYVEEHHWELTMQLAHVIYMEQNQINAMATLEKLKDYQDKMTKAEPHK